MDRLFAADRARRDRQSRLERNLAFKLEVGDVKAWASHFDSYVVQPGDASQDVSTPRRGITGLPTPGGPQGGTRETCNWIAAALPKPSTWPARR